MKQPTFNGKELLPLSVMEFPYVCVDEYMKCRLEIKLIHSIVVALE